MRERESGESESVRESGSVRERVGECERESGSVRESRGV